MPRLNKKAVALLNTAAEAFKAGKTLYATEAEFEKLEKAGFVEVNRSLQDGERFVIRATSAGVEFAETPRETAERAPRPVISPDAIEIDQEVYEPAPPKRGGAPSTSIYPFERLTVYPAQGSSFFIAATPEREKPWKQLGSAVASANKKFKGQGMKFSIRDERRNPNLPESDTNPRGARIRRVA